MSGDYGYNEQKLEVAAAVERCFDDVQHIRASEGTTPERSLYVSHANLVNALGATLRPRVFCTLELAHHDGKGKPASGLTWTMSWECRFKEVRE